jgi:RNA polymerase sigma-70 factor, ECF subfamily
MARSKFVRASTFPKCNNRTMTLEELLRIERGPVLATLIRYLRDITAAEDAVQEAALAAMQTWPRTGTPANPAAWLTTTAKNKALDRIRREASRGDREREAVLLAIDDAPVASGAIRNDQLRLIFTVCHPALAIEQQIALALRTLGGLTTPEIAQLFMVPETTMGQRISRAKAKIASARIPYRIPEDHELPDRLQAVLEVVSAIFTTGHHAPIAARFNARIELCEEALRLAALVAELMPDEPEALGLHALLLTTHARRYARVTSLASKAETPEQILLKDQDRTTWDHSAIRAASQILEKAIRQNRTGPFQLQAAIASVHSEARTFAETDWADITRLYELLEMHQPTSVVKVNRSVAEAFAHGPGAGLAVLDQVPAKDVSNWFRYWATRAELLCMANDVEAAQAAWSVALTMPMNETDRRAIVKRMSEVSDPSNDVRQLRDGP